MTVSAPCCGEEDSCVIKNRWFAQCVPSAKVNTTWDGRVLDCEAMPEDLYPVEQMKALDASCADGACAMKWEQCGGGPNYTVSLQCCEEGTECVVKVRGRHPAHFETYVRQPLLGMLLPELPYAIQGTDV